MIFAILFTLLGVGFVIYLCTHPTAVIDTEYDKFSGKKTIKTNFCSLKVGALSNARYSFRYFVEPDGNPEGEYVIDVKYDGQDWLHLDGGVLRLLLNDSERIELPFVVYNRSGVSNNRCCEEGVYSISKDLLNTIANSKTCEFKLEGSSSYILGKANSMIPYAKKLMHSV